KVIINPIYNPEIVEMTYNQIKDFIKQNNLILSIAGGFFLSHKVEKSNLYDLIDYLNASRNKYKKLYAETLNKVYDNKQRAFKIVTNSVYGYLGLETSRMYNVYLVNNITLTSRYINKLCALSINKLLEDKIDSFDEDTFRNVILKEFLDKYIEYDMDKPFTLYGDTDSIFVKIADKSYSDWKEAKERGDKILQFIDKVVVKKYIANVMNLDPDEARWKLGYQGIGKVFLLPVKKKYIFYFYEKEDGTSGLDYRGIELRRSDFPRLTKEYMQQLIDMLLVNPKPMNELRQFATNVEREFITRINNFDPLVARSSSFTKKLDDYKKVPAYVVAMIFWNRAFSKVFVPGSKGYSYRVKFVNPPSDILNIIKQVEKEYNLSELSWITIPEGYTEKLPSWIKVDTNYMLNFAWKDRIKDLIPEEKETLFTFDDF
ncbi:MAG: DNA polymerase domain-containing protein, partial [Candidatus Micrarchaeaceae archaeon]